MWFCRGFWLYWWPHSLTSHGGSSHGEKKKTHKKTKPIRNWKVGFLLTWQKLEMDGSHMLPHALTCHMPPHHFPPN